MVEDAASQMNSRPPFFDQRGVPESIAAPDRMIGIYLFSRSKDLSPPDREYTRVGVLTSEGWVPPAPEILVHRVAHAGDGPNDLGTIGNYAVARPNRLAIDPREFRSKLSSQATIIADDVSPIYGSRYSEPTEIYIPDGLGSERIAEYLCDCIRPATRYLVERRGEESPSQEQLASVLVDAYDIDHQTALRTVEIASGK